MSGGLAEIRGYLVKGESEEGWLGMCRILEGSEGGEREMLVGYVSQHTKGWGESIRRPLYGWWERKQRGEVTGYEGLVADWSMYAWEEGRVAGEVRGVPCLKGMRVRWIPAGTFWMGSGEDDTEAYDDEKTRHEVTITRGFWMGETPVTQGQYQAIMGENPAHFTEAGLDAPVEEVSWYDAAAFANKLSALEGLPACFVGEGEEMDGVGNKTSDYVGCKGWRLPTEAEWEYACRAGTTTPRYGDLDDIAWHHENSSETTHAVGEKKANPWGLCDTLGNVLEWCYDGYDEYSAQAATDPVVAARTLYRVLRGGGWHNSAQALRAAFRNSIVSTNHHNVLGFRLVRR